METLVNDSERLVFRKKENHYMITESEETGKFLVTNYLKPGNGKINVKKVTLIEAKNRFEVRQKILNGTIKWFQT